MTSPSSALVLSNDTTTTVPSCASISVTPMPSFSGTLTVTGALGAVLSMITLLTKFENVAEFLGAYTLLLVLWAPKSVIERTVIARSPSIPTTLEVT